MNLLGAELIIVGVIAALMLIAAFALWLAGRRD
jgi:hypothetical protein